MSTLPDITVIVPAWRPVDLQMTSLSMTLNPDVAAEWIVVDDGSGRDYESVFGMLPSRFQLLRLDRNYGQAAARNAGIAHARGRWIKFLDADDQLDSQHLSTLLHASKSLPANIIPFAPTKHVLANGASWVNNSWHGLCSRPEAQLARMLYSPFLHHCGAIFPRSLLVDLGGYDEDLVTDEDGDLLIRVLLSGAHFLPVPQVNYAYYHGSNSMRVSADDGLAKLSSRLRVCDKVQQAYVDRQIPLDVRDGLARRLDKIALSYWMLSPDVARETFKRARHLSPGYHRHDKPAIRLIRRLGGPPAQLFLASLWRLMRGRPAGGAQG